MCLEPSVPPLNCIVCSWKLVICVVKHIAKIDWKCWYTSWSIDTEPPSITIKSQCELKGLEFKSGYVALYTEAREAMAALYDEENFGPQKLAEMEDETDPNKYKAVITDQRKIMKIGY